MQTTYTTSGTCCRFIDIELDGDRVRSINFIGGCNGNAQGISALVKGMPVTEVIERLEGIICRGTTSCPDQLSKALKEITFSIAS
jgi:uncharacterized protein (TIGR03905 family)